MEFQEIRKAVKKVLDKERYEHTKGVMYTAACLAMAHGVDINQAMLAGLLHDCAKNVPNDKKIKICEDNAILISEVERENPTLLHAKVGALFAKTLYEVEDPAIIHAIKVHTTGEPDMSVLDKIIFIADYIEPKRDKAAHLDTIRKLAFEDLDACIAEILYDTLHYLNSKSGAIDPTTQLTYEYYKPYEREQEWKH